MANTNNSFLQNILRGLQLKFKKLFTNPHQKAGLNWFKIKYLKHQPATGIHVHQWQGKNIHYTNPHDLLHSLQEIFVEEIYKISFHSNTPYILDCGSNIGLSVLYLKSLYPQATITAFEPDAANFALLEKNITGAGYTGVNLRNEAIWIENGTIHFANTGSLSSKISSDAGNNLIEVKATRLRDLLDRKIDFLKMDIEGVEYEVLKDCADRLTMIDYLFIEYHGTFKQPGKLTDILQLVTDAGFTYYIKEAADLYPTPFHRPPTITYDVQLNIFCFKKDSLPAD